MGEASTQLEPGGGAIHPIPQFLVDMLKGRIFQLERENEYLRGLLDAALNRPEGRND